MVFYDSLCAEFGKSAPTITASMGELHATFFDIFPDTGTRFWTPDRVPVAGSYSASMDPYASLERPTPGRNTPKNGTSITLISLFW